MRACPTGIEDHDTQGHTRRPSADFRDSPVGPGELPGESKYAAVERTADWIFDNAAFWVWEEDGAIQGFSAADPRNGEIFALFIHPAYEGRGIGRVLLPPACQILRDAGYKVATLTTEPGTRAERFYRRDGWTEIGREDDGQIIFQKAL